LRGRTLAELRSGARALGGEEWLGIVREDVSPIDDVRASGAYRKQVMAPLAQRVVEKAIERAEREE
jgi:xanthine dehydrogenase iron-sulfur cluster and FAD-binding subunit A